VNEIGCTNASGLQAHAPWPMAGRCPRQEGQARVLGPSAAKLAWSVPNDSAFQGSHGSPTVAVDGTIYLPGLHGVVALAPDGKEKWVYGPSFSAEATAIAADGTVYATGYPGFHAIGPDGVARWTFKGCSTSQSAPNVASDGTIYFGCNDGFLYALDHAGTLKWKGALHDLASSAPAIFEHSIYIGSGDGNLYAFDDLGKSKWMFKVSASTSSTPVVGVDGTVFIGSLGNFFGARPDGTKKWILTPSEARFWSSALGADGTIFVCAWDGVYAIAPDGHQKWKAPVTNCTSRPIVDASGNVYVGSLDAHIDSIAPSGAVRWSYQTKNRVLASPALGANGTLYVIDQNGNAYAFE
jgi:outer membrane protein assembly factor BamB